MPTLGGVKKKKKATLPRTSTDSLSGRFAKKEGKSTPPTTSIVPPRSEGVATKLKKSAPQKVSADRRSNKPKHQAKGGQARSSETIEMDEIPGASNKKSMNTAQKQPTLARKKKNTSSSARTKKKKSGSTKQGLKPPAVNSKRTKQESRTPVQKKMKMSPSNSTPSTLSSHSTSTTKRVLKQMNDLQLKKKPRRWHVIARRQSSSIRLILRRLTGSTRYQCVTHFCTTDKTVQK